ncbi:MAG: GNAT family N-acetyltransferase [Anaerolineae bacterium]|nr:GNAT family N-acetyltransferase [Anaerolineae bacterium]
MTPIPRVLERAQYPILAEALGDAPDRVQSTHLLRQGACRVVLVGDASRFSGAIVQAHAWPEEPTGYGADPQVLWALLQHTPGWECVNVSCDVAAPLGEIMAREMGVDYWMLDDVYLVLEGADLAYPHPAVRRLGVEDLDLLEAAPHELRSSLWSGPGELLSEGIVACAIDGGRIVSTALMVACSARYGEVGVHTAEAYRGQGMATAAASLVVRGIREMGRVPVWSAGATNAASLRVAHKLGYVEVSRRRYVIPKREQG